MALISEHPSSLVRDQYLMQVSDRCTSSPEQLRALAQRPGKAADPSHPSPAPTKSPGRDPGPPT